MKIDAKTKACAVIGNPIEHSLSPILHNAAYEYMKLNYVYVAFKVEDAKEAIQGIRGLGIRGISVTIPHKTEVMKYLDTIDATAAKIGAVNTIVNEDGKLCGYNTDCDGALRALKEHTSSLKSKKIVLIGAGGAAKAISFGLMNEKADLTILNRTKEKAKELAQKTNASFGDLSDLSVVQKCDVLINATSYGMSPHEEESLLPKDILNKNILVLDIVYNPKETKLIQNAKKIGCDVVYGYKMLLYQAISQFELFTDNKAPVSCMEEALVNELKRRQKK